MHTPASAAVTPASYHMHTNMYTSLSDMVPCGNPGNSLEASYGTDVQFTPIFTQYSLYILDDRTQDDHAFRLESSLSHIDYRM